MDYGLSRLSLVTALLGSVSAFSTDVAIGGTLSLMCRYPVDYPSSTEALMIIPREIAFDPIKSTVSWNGTVTEVAADITVRSIRFSFNEYKYIIDRTSGAIRFFSPQGLERANEYRREMLQGLLRQGKSLAQAQADVEAGLQNQIYAHEHSGNCNAATGARF
jgi:hypothetical protein